MLPFQAVAAALAMEDAEALYFALSDVQFGSSPMNFQLAISISANATPFDAIVLEEARKHSRARIESN